MQVLTEEIQKSSQAQHVLGEVVGGLKANLTTQHYLDHPKDYLKLVYPTPWYKQVDILESIRDHDITCIRSCNDVGKTAGIGVAILWWLDCYRPYSKVVSTARNYSALQFMLWARIRNCYKELKHRFNNAPINIFDFRPDEKNFPEWFAVGYNPKIEGDEAEAFQGHHAKHLLFVIDEAIATHPAILKAIEGSLFSQGTHLVAVYNPTDKTSIIAQYETDPRTNVIHISQYDLFESPEYKANPDAFRDLADPEKTKVFVKTYGWDSPIVRARVRGEWAENVEDAAIKYTDCMAVKKRYEKWKNEEEDSTFEIGKIEKINYSWDVAGEGNDENVLRRLIGGDKGIVIEKVDQWMSPHDESLGRVVEHLHDAKRKYWVEKEENPELMLVVDAIGEGSHVPSLMTQWHPDIQITAFKAGETAEEIAERHEVVLLNKISEAWYRTGLLFSSDVAEWKPCACELDEYAIHQLSSRKRSWKLRLNEPQQWFIEPKVEWREKNRGRSPDDADSIVMGVWGYFCSEPVRFFSV